MTRLAEAAELVSKYPELDERETARLVKIFPALSALEMALIMSEAKLAGPLETFRRDHASRIRTPFRQYAVLVAIAVLGFAIILWQVIARG